MGNQEVIIDYLKRYIKDNQGLNSAIMIKGSWGSGKTYFAKKILSSHLKEYLTKEEKHLCYISLNGLSSSQEFMKRIQAAIIKKCFQKISRKKRKASNEGIMDIITGIDTVWDNVNIQGWVSLLRGAKNKLSKFISDKKIASTIFIFDDLERCQMDICETLGLINDLIEHEECKCIILANEDAITDTETYKKVKEKFVSRTIEYIPKVGSFFEQVRKAYEGKPLNYLNDKSWENFITPIKSSVQNLRTLQSTFSIANEVFGITYNAIREEKENVSQYILLRILKDIYEIETLCKSGRVKPENENKGKITGVYNLGLSGEYGSYVEIFNFVINIIYDGIYDEQKINENIKLYIEDVKVNGELSPIVILKDYHQIEDDEIQAKLNEIETSIKTITIEQASTLINIIIPLVDLGFRYKNESKFDNVLDIILEEISITGSIRDIEMGSIEFLTILEGDQKRKYHLAMKRIKEHLKGDRTTLSLFMKEVLQNDKWDVILRSDMEKNELTYKVDKKYLSYFDLDVLVDNLSHASNKQLYNFRNTLYQLYKRQSCLKTFSYDVEAANLLIEKLGKIKVSGKVNVQTASYIKGDLEVSFLTKH